MEHILRTNHFCAALRRQFEDAVPVDTSWVGFEQHTHAATYLHGCELRYSGDGKAMKLEPDFVGGMKRQFHSDSKKKCRKGLAYVAACDDIMMDESRVYRSVGSRSS